MLAVPEEEGGGGEVRRTVTGTSSPTAPPLNQLPALLASGPLIWRSSAAAVAVLALEVYSSGVEFTLTGRISDQELAAQVQGEPRFFARVVSGHGREGLRFSVLCAGEPVRVDFLDGSYDSRGSFRYRAWAAASGDLTFALAWPAAGISYAEHEVTGVRDAAQGTITLWPTG